MRSVSMCMRVYCASLVFLTPRVRLCVCMARRRLSSLAPRPKVVLANLVAVVHEHPALIQRLTVRQGEAYDDVHEEDQIAHAIKAKPDGSGDHTLKARVGATVKSDVKWRDHACIDESRRENAVPATNNLRVRIHRMSRFTAQPLAHASSFVIEFILGIGVGFP